QALQSVQITDKVPVRSCHQFAPPLLLRECVEEFSACSFRYLQDKVISSGKTKEFLHAVLFSSENHYNPRDLRGCHHFRSAEFFFDGNR
ncbi:MAG: hypothetical protein AAFW82_08395, partial [Pseudomonadota bacterium]